MKTTNLSPWKLRWVRAKVFSRSKNPKYCVSNPPKKYILKTSPQSDVSFSIDYAAELNESQHAVVTQGEGPCLVLAGAGSGKTRTLVYSVAYLIEKGVRPEEILLV